MTRNTHKQRVLTAFMASYSLLLLIPVIMGLVVFVMASCILRSDTLTTSSRVLENAVQTIESAYDTASDLTLGISTSRDFCRRLDEVQPGDKYAIAELAGMASALHTSNNLISRYFLYYHGSDDAQFVLEESRAYADLDVYYKACFQYGALDSEQFFAELADIYDSLIEQTQSGRRRASMMLMENVLQYIAENYRDPNLSLTMLAQHFGLTEPYLSKRFKQHVGVNVSAYLEQQRISRAHELLRTTGMSVQAISDSVGYANIRSFRRAYIRVVGCPPSADRGGEETEENAQDGEEA